MEAEDTETLVKTLKGIFGHEDFMSMDQKKGTKEVLRGKGDVYINLQPGAGKSICFQLPAVLKENSLTVVFVPTNCLGEVQVDFLKQRNITAEYLCPVAWPKLRKVIIEDSKAVEMKLQLLYASTEKNIADFVFDLIAQLDNRKALSFLVFDEAQCISRLSNDYKLSYREVAKSVRRLFPAIRKIVLTGSATYEIKNDITKTLGMKKPRIIFPTSLYAKYQDVRFIDILPEPLQDLKNFIDKHIGPSDYGCAMNLRDHGIIFCRKKQAAKKIERELKAMGIPVVSCHGDLSSKDRREIIRRWRDGAIKVIAVTPQFALGLHRPNVRFVVHWSMPMSIQQLCQGNGKSAQDGTGTWCRVYFSIEEENNILMRIKSMPRGTREEANILSRTFRFFKEFVDYCFGTRCRVVAQMSCFGQIVGRCRNYCDVCCDLKNLKRRIDAFFCVRAKLKKSLHVQAPDNQAGQLRGTNRIHRTYESCLRKTREVVFAAPMTRELSYNRLLDELTQNYKEVGAEVKRRIEMEHIPEIARQLEFSVFMGANDSRKYNHDIVQTIRVIRKSKASKVACGYLRYYEPEQKSVHDAEPEVLAASNEADERTRRAVRKTAIDIVETDSGSTTE